MGHAGSEGTKGALLGEVGQEEKNQATKEVGARRPSNDGFPNVVKCQEDATEEVEGRSSSVDSVPDMAEFKETVRSTRAAAKTADFMRRYYNLK